MPNRIGVSPDQRREDRKRRQRERERRTRMKNVARQLGRDADSITDEDVRQYFRMWKERDDTEYARRQALSAEERRQEDIESDKRSLKRHLTPQFASGFSGNARLSHYPIFQLQNAPDSRNGATCQLTSCTDRILPDDYRIAVTPGDNAYRNPDYYHVHCFEELLDLTSPHYVSRFEPDMTKYILDHGAQCILEECVRKWESQIEGANTEPDEWSIADGLWQEMRHASRQAVQRDHDLIDMIDATHEADDALSMSSCDWDITEWAVEQQPLSYSPEMRLKKITELSDEDRIEREALGDSIRKIKDYAVVRVPNLMPFH